MYTEVNSKIGFDGLLQPLNLNPPASLNWNKLSCFGAGERWFKFRALTFQKPTLKFTSGYKFILVCSLSLLVACSSKDALPPTPAAVPVFTATVEEMDVPLYIESLGTITSKAVLEIRPQISGLLKEVHFKEGQEVKKGDELFLVDPRPYKIKLKEAQAKFARSSASLNASRKKLARYNSLSNKDWVPEQEWDDLEREVALNEGEVAMDEASLAAADLNLQNCVIKAPMNGKTGKLLYPEGSLLNDSQQAPIVTLCEIDNLACEFTLTEKEVQQLSKEQLSGKLLLTLCPLCGGDEIVGSLHFYNHSFEKETGLLNLSGNVANPNRTLLPGQSVKVKIPNTILKAAKIVPQRSVKINQQGPYVFVVKEDNKVEIRQVKLGEEFLDKVVVIEGVNPLEKVVTDGHLRLSEGTLVEVKEDLGSI